MKLTKRKGFNFFRSYFDVYNELPDEDKLAFIDALLNKQFMGVNPKLIKGTQSRFAYISQLNSIDSQVKGYEDKTKTRLDGTPYNNNKSTPTEGGTQGGADTPTVQVEEKEKEKEQYIYSEKDFLHNWGVLRSKYMKQPTNIKKLDFSEAKEFEDAKKVFTKEEINKALYGLFKQENKNIASMYLKPKHFLENVSKYFNAELSKEYSLYGAKKQTGQL